jgi:hypothetical protein
MRDDFSISASSHNIKFGADVQSMTPARGRARQHHRHLELRQRSSRSTRRAPDDTGDAARAGSNYFTASFPGLIRLQPHTITSFYVQDEWKVGGGSR